MAATHVNPTRMELTRLKKKLVTATRGHKLLKDKRDELMRQFLDLVRENKALREKVEAGIAAANQNFVLARAGMQAPVLDVALMTPKQEVFLECSAAQCDERGSPGVHLSDPDFRRKRHLFLWLCLYVQRPGRSGEVLGRHSARHAAVGGGVRNRAS